MAAGGPSMARKRLGVASTPSMTSDHDLPVAGLLTAFDDHDVAVEDPVPDHRVPTNPQREGRAIPAQKGGTSTLSGSSTASIGRPATIVPARGAAAAGSSRRRTPRRIPRIGSTSPASTRACACSWSEPRERSRRPRRVSSGFGGGRPGGGAPGARPARRPAGGRDGGRRSSPRASRPFHHEEE